MAIHQTKARPQIPKAWRLQWPRTIRGSEEMEKVRVHYAQRMQSNLDQVAKEKEALRNWQKAMQHETQRVGEVIDLCGKQPGCCRGGPRRRETRGHAAAWKHFISTANLDRTLRSVNLRLGQTIGFAQ